MKALYTASATAHGGREGKVTSSDEHLAASLTLPKELGGPGGATRKPLTDGTINGRVTLSADERRYILSVELEEKLDGISAEEGWALMHAAHQVCPYSNATRGNIDVKLSVC